MKKRKFLSEFGLNVFTSYKTLVAVEHLDKIPNDHDYHIYAILSSPKLYFDKTTLNSSKEGICYTINEMIEDNIIKHEVSNIRIDKDMDHSLLGLECEFPFTTLKITNGDANYRTKHPKSPEEIYIDAEMLFNTSNKVNTMAYEVLYIGQSYGKKGERNALERLKTHSTLQKIMIDYNTKRPDRKVFILLLEMEPLLMTSHDGLSKDYLATDTENDKHIEKVLSNLPENDQVINITEAALINYFKPDYNINFVDNFPNKNHKGYTQYFNLDYNLLTIEIDLEFEKFPPVYLYSDTNSIKSSFEFVRFNLFNEANRLSMYDIFRTVED